MTTKTKTPTKPRLPRVRELYPSTYCNQAHYLDNGRPYKHECRIIPPAALRAERAGDTSKAIELMHKASEKVMIPRQGVAVQNLPAVQTCRDRGYTTGCVLNSDRWQCPRRIVEIRKRDVVLTSIEGRQKASVLSFPQDVEVVP